MRITVAIPCYNEAPTIAKVVAEVGQVSGGDVSVYNSFSQAADKSRLYGSVGIRISF